MSKAKKPSNPKYLKIVYFDEESASDFLDMKFGGRASKETNNVAERNYDIAGKAVAETGAKFRLLDLFSIGGSAAGESSIDSSRRSLLSKTLSNTILTDYLNEVNDKSGVVVLDVSSVKPAPNSLTQIKMFSPYINLVNSEGQPLNLSHMDEVLASAKGYYEMVGIYGDGKKCVLRFNLKAFRNNYGLPDLPRMDLEYHGIRVGETAEEYLDAESELGAEVIQETLTTTDFLNEKSNQTGIGLEVYDVLFAGVKL